jgi:ABC-type antimicrobial peptide transport system permease subunit
VVNTLLMSVAERTHEIGVLMAIGMRRRGVVGMFLLESLVLGTLAGVLGLAGGWAIVAAWGAHGIDLSGVAEAMEYIGIGRVLYPSLSWGRAGAATGITLLVAVGFSVYPAVRAARLSPVTAIRGLG